MANQRANIQASPTPLPLTSVLWAYQRMAVIHSKVGQAFKGMMAGEGEATLIIYQDYTGETTSKSLKSMQSYNKTDNVAMPDLGPWPGEPTPYS